MEAAVGQSGLSGAERREVGQREDERGGEGGMGGTKALLVLRIRGLASERGCYLTFHNKPCLASILFPLGC